MNTLFNKIAAIFLLLSVSTAVIGDDIDLIDSETLYETNVLFVMDLSGSMNEDIDGNLPPIAPKPSRLAELQGAFQDIVADTDFDDINFGLSVFSGNGTGKDKAHGITYPIGPLAGGVGEKAQNILNRNSTFIHRGISYMPDATTNNTREYLHLLAAGWVAEGKTPIVDALHEAALYFRGQDVKWGRRTADDIRSAHPSTYVGSLSNVITTCPSMLTGRACGSGDSTEVLDSPPGRRRVGSIDHSTRPSNSNCRDNGTLQNCSDVPLNETAPVCGSACDPDPNPRFSSSYPCPLNITSAAACRSYLEGSLSHTPVWSSCSGAPVNTNCRTDNEGTTTCNTQIQYSCSERMHRVHCTVPRSWTCPVYEPTCAVCAPPESQVVGSAIYRSPITQECPKNGIVLLSDGEPNVEGTPDVSSVLSMIGSYAGTCDSLASDGRCGPELAKYLADTDHNTSMSGVQNVVTYTVGLALAPSDPASVYLRSIASMGNGEFITANDRASLTAAFKMAINSISRKARSFSVPSYSVDTSLLSHSGFVYVPVFDRGAAVWPGNLKKFKLINGVLSDVAGHSAVDLHGGLKDNAKDYWATSSSTDAVTSGGAANMIDPSTRQVYTDNGMAGTAISRVTLDSSVSKVLLGDAGMTDTYRTEIINYIRGENSDGSARHHMGDIIHSKPIQLDIATGNKRVIFIGSNEGYLHAIEDSDGKEIFAFMPSELLKNIDKQFSGNSSGKHTYGVDGPITLWIDEEVSAGTALVGNGILDPGEKAYLFFGLRRGGSSYYALEVTDPSNPKLVWKFSNTANSWSQPVVAKLQYKNGQNGLSSPDAPSPVLIIGGGYNEDASGSAISDKGNQVLIIDIETGKQVWSTKVAEASLSLAPDSVDNPVPARIRVMDVDKNGSVDRLYFGDIGGNIWRADLNAGNFSGVVSERFDISKAKLHKVAELGSRKIFEEPDVAIFKHSGKYVATIAIGTGDRTKPIAEPATDDRFFVLYDKDVLKLPTQPTITMGQLVSSTTLSTSTNILDPSFYGWYKTLTSTKGEKVLASAITFQNKVLFTTFGTTSITPDACNPSNVNQARLYVMDLLSGVVHRNDAETSGEILGTPQIIFDKLQAHDGSACVKGDCIRPVTIRVGRVGPISLPTPAGAATPDVLPRVYWLDNEK